MVGWPASPLDGSFGAYDPDSLDDAELEAAYRWSGEYDVTQRPWYRHGRTSPSPSWTPPYADPVQTTDVIVSCVQSLPSGGVAIAGTWLAPPPPRVSSTGYT